MLPAPQRRDARQFQNGCDVFVFCSPHGPPRFGIGDGDGVVQHGAEHSLERKPGMEKCGRFEQEIEFMESARGRVAAGYVLDAAEEFGNRGIEQ